MIFFILFVIIPLIEIGLFIAVGEEIGLFRTLFLCILTAVIGAFLIRWQGLKTLFSARHSLDRGLMPVTEIFDGICIAVAGALLMTPGFFTDGIGFSLLVPQIRALLRKKLGGYFDIKPPGGSHGSDYHYRHESEIIDVEYETIEDDDKP